VKIYLACPYSHQDSEIRAMRVSCADMAAACAAAAGRSI